ncbi:hypothetical protein KC360_g155 [Hortaea werneckii]|nr:hypothetical protein KC360_g155 [Hortaea werneckii]
MIGWLLIDLGFFDCNGVKYDQAVHFARGVRQAIRLVLVFVCEERLAKLQRHQVTYLLCSVYLGPRTCLIGKVHFAVSAGRPSH